MDRQLINDAKAVLKTLTNKIPSSLIGIEKQLFIGKDIIEKLPENQKMLLKNLVNHFLTNMRQLEASDIDMGGWASRRQVRLRIHGIKKPVPEFGSYEIEESDILIQNLLMHTERERLYVNRNHDFSHTSVSSDGQTCRYRADVYFDLESLALNIRSINAQVRPYDSFKFQASVTRVFSLVHTKEGLVLITGITGSGKSSTLDAIVDLNNRTTESHIIIIASPVEFVHESKSCLIRHREVGRDTLSFKQGTIEALRQDPDIIIIGEMRDPDTIFAALEVADSGHKVFSTLHTSSAVESIDRIIGEVVPGDQERVRLRLADILRCVISQKLIPSLDGKRVLAKEVMLMIPSIKAAIKNNNTGEIYQMISEGSPYGMTTMEQDLKQLYLERKISLESAFNYANNKRRMQQILNPK
ncbi:Flp pilus assembly complex ATPase component TadA [candidate division KSB1 bacterium]|nr:Flp pilus assembly complex ATPase component TadA [candidate division KSB1 bacterium]